MAGIGLPLLVIAWLLVARILWVERVAILRARCTSCGNITQMLFYRVHAGRSWFADVPYGMAVFGGTSYCPHTLVYE